MTTLNLVLIAVCLVLLAVTLWTLIAEVTLRGQLRDALAQRDAALDASEYVNARMAELRMHNRCDVLQRHFFKHGAICLRCGESNPRYRAPEAQTEPDAIVDLVNMSDDPVRLSR